MLRRTALLGLVAIIAVAMVPTARQSVLRAAGASLITHDPLAPSDVGVITEFGEGDEIEASDLYHQHLFSRVVVLEPAPTDADREYMRRGIYRDDLVVTTLRQLGVPAEAIVTVEAGEGGTTDSTQALADWIRVHPGRAIVIVSPSHGRRFRRALLRVWPDHAPPPSVTAPRHTSFRSADWWESRRTLRDGLFELEKLAFDYLQHPW